MNKAFFLDRDGTINVEIGYLHEAEKTQLLPRVAEAIELIHRAGYLAIVVTNQSGVAKKMYPVDNIHEVHARIQRDLLAFSPQAVIDAWYYCPHDPKITGECSCRKPLPGMLVKAAADFGVDPGESFMIGDRMSDVNAGISAGCAGVCMVTTGDGNIQDADDASVVLAPDLYSAVEKLLKTR